MQFLKVCKSTAQAVTNISAPWQPLETNNDDEMSPGKEEETADDEQ